MKWRTWDAIKNDADNLWQRAKKNPELRKEARNLGGSAAAGSVITAGAAKVAGLAAVGAVGAGAGIGCGAIAAGAGVGALAGAA